MYRWLYKTLSSHGKPVIEMYLKKRLDKGKEDAERGGERRGQAQRLRPSGKLIWFHGASVGESLSLLILIDRILAKYPDIHVMVTTGTVTSAGLMEKRLPDRAFHQYIPVDYPEWTASFLDYWKPDMVVWAESDFWPNMLSEVKKRSIPSVLVNARMSEKSFKRWQKSSSWIKEILSTFYICLAQNKFEAERLSKLGAHQTIISGNLKYASKRLPCDEDELEKFEKMLENRTCWQMASTHAGEEEMAIRTHKFLQERDIPAPLTVIVPRHPERGAEIAKLCDNMGVSYVRRSEGQDITDETDIYIADTLGDLGLLFRAVSFVVIGGSFVKHGGHNPIEPAQLSCQIIYGPHMFNFVTICDDFQDVSGARAVKSEEDLQEELVHLLLNSVEGKQLSDNAWRLITTKSGVVDDIVKSLEPVFEQAGL